MKNVYKYCGVCVKSSDMHTDEVMYTPKELRYCVKMDNVHAIILIICVKCHIFVNS